MSFSYTGNLTTPLNFVRFHTGDTNADESYLSDEVIHSLIATTESKEKAVVAALTHIIMQLSKPDFRADWLSINHADARKGYEMMLAQKKREFGLLYHQATHTPVSRMDGDE